MHSHGREAADSRYTTVKHTRDHQRNAWILKGTMTMKTFFYIQQHPEKPSCGGTETRNSAQQVLGDSENKGLMRRLLKDCIPLPAHSSGELSFLGCNQELTLALLEITCFFHF